MRRPKSQRDSGVSFLRKIFGGGKTTPRANAHAPVHYKDFAIHPQPRKTANGWSTEAVIRKTEGETMREHYFIRADTCSSEEGALALIESKAKTLIDQRGEKIFP